MIIENEPYLIEYNVRMGDPECQTILPRLKTDLIDLFLACSEKRLTDVDIQWTNKKSLCVVLCSNGYPETFKKNIEINNLNKIKTNLDDHIFHAGTIQKNKKILAVGGRVLNFVSLSTILIQQKKYRKQFKKLNWSGGFYRKDIGHRVIE